MSRQSDYELCKANGWGPGTRLVGDEGGGPTIIEITYLSRQNLLATTISHDGKPGNGREGSWTLCCREWKEANR